MNLMTFLKKLFHEICQKRLKNDLSMFPVASIIINTPCYVTIFGLELEIIAEQDYGGKIAVCTVSMVASLF